MNKLTRISATVASSLALVAGFSGIAGASTITNDGNHSNNTVTNSTKVTSKVTNQTDAHLFNLNGQLAASGDAHVEDNHGVDSVATGDASNSNSTAASVTVNNTASSTPDLSAAMPMGGGGSNDSIDNSGDHSNNTISNTTTVKSTVENDTSACVTNVNMQGAFSGDAHVEDNHNVGSVSTGNASNTNSTTFTMNVTN